MLRDPQDPPKIGEFLEGKTTATNMEFDEGQVFHATFEP